MDNYYQKKFNLVLSQLLKLHKWDKLKYDYFYTCYESSSDEDFIPTMLIDKFGILD